MKRVPLRALNLAELEEEERDAILCNGRDLLRDDRGVRHEGS